MGSQETSHLMGKDMKNSASNSLTDSIHQPLWLRNSVHELVHLQKPDFYLHVSLCADWCRITCVLKTRLSPHCTCQRTAWGGYVPPALVPSGTDRRHACLPAHTSRPCDGLWLPTTVLPCRRKECRVPPAQAPEVRAKGSFLKLASFILFDNSGKFELTN